ncbi:MAG: GTPase, partial [Lachnospiraceae bacterium]
ALDDPEHISLEGYPDKLMAKTRGLSQELKKLIDSADNGKMLKDGIRTVILGKPNAGKSSLLNVLVGEDKAIVTSVAGTTRDVLEESIKLHGIGLNMIDTAGIRDTEDEVEKIGVEKARKYANQADLVIYVVDSSRELDENDEEIIELIRDKKVIVLLNKTDLEPVVTEEQIKDKFREIYEGEEKHDDSLHVIRTSTKDNTGIDEFEKTIQDMFFAGRIAVNDEIYITNQRHKEALVEAYDSLKMVQKSLEDEMPEDFYSIDLMSAYAALGRIIGEEVGEDLVNEIFSKFCMGK